MKKNIIIKINCIIFYRAFILILSFNFLINYIKTQSLIYNKNTNYDDLESLHNNNNININAKYNTLNNITDNSLIYEDNSTVITSSDIKVYNLKNNQSSNLSQEYYENIFNTLNFNNSKALNLIERNNTNDNNLYDKPNIDFVNSNIINDLEKNNGFKYDNYLNNIYSKDCLNYNSIKESIIKSFNYINNIYSTCVNLNNLNSDDNFLYKNNKFTDKILCIELGRICGNWNKLYSYKKKIIQSNISKHKETIKPVIIVKKENITYNPVIKKVKNYKQDNKKYIISKLKDDCDDLLDLKDLNTDINNNNNNELNIDYSFKQIHEKKNNSINKDNNNKFNNNITIENSITSKFYRNIVLNNNKITSDTFKEGVNLIVIDANNNYNVIFSKTYNLIKDKYAPDLLSDKIDSAEHYHINIITAFGNWIDGISPKLVNSIKNIGGPDLNILYNVFNQNNDYYLKYSYQDMYNNNNNNNKYFLNFVLIGRKGLCSNNGYFDITSNLKINLYEKLLNKFALNQAYYNIDNNINDNNDIQKSSIVDDCEEIQLNSNRKSCYDITIDIKVDRFNLINDNRYSTKFPYIIEVKPNKIELVKNNIYTFKVIVYYPALNKNYLEYDEDNNRYNYNMELFKTTFIENLSNYQLNYNSININNNIPLKIQCGNNNDKDITLISNIDTSDKVSITCVIDTSLYKELKIDYILTGNVVVEYIDNYTKFRYRSYKDTCNMFNYNIVSSNEFIIKKTERKSSLLTKINKFKCCPKNLPCCPLVKPITIPNYKDKNYTPNFEDKSYAFNINTRYTPGYNL